MSQQKRNHLTRNSIFLRCEDLMNYSLVSVIFPFFYCNLHYGYQDD